MISKFSGAINFALLLSILAVSVWTHGSVAQTFGAFYSSLQIVATDPTVGNDPNDRRAVDMNCTFNGMNANSAYVDQNCMQLALTANHGQNVYGAGTNAKTSFVPLSVTANYPAAGQKFLYGAGMNCWGMGDCGMWGGVLSYAGGPVAGDEGTAFSDATYLQQQTSLVLATVTSVPAQTTCNTALTQTVTGGFAVQTVTVASASGCVAGNWIEVDHILPSGDYGYPNNEAVQLAAVGSGTISGVFQNSQASSATITPALVLNISSTYQFGEQRKLVNLTRPSYSAGTVSSIGGHTFTGSGTAWTAGMVGGNSANIGCIALAADTYNGAPFNGSGANGALNSWYEITAVADSTHLTVSSMSVAGDLAYYGKGPIGGGTPSAYVIRPCAEVLRIIGNNQVIAESAAATWSPGDSLELAISPYPDNSGFQYKVSRWVPGGIARGFMNVQNNGARTWPAAFNASSNMATGSNADTVGWDSAFLATGSVNYGLNVSGAAKAAVTLDQTCPSGAIQWGGGATGSLGSAYICPNATTGGLELQMDMNQSYPGSAGFLTVYNHNYFASNGVTGLQWGSVFGTVPKTFSQLTACSSALEGFESAVVDSTTAVFNATIAGSGANHVKAYCNGTNWTVH